MEEFAFHGTADRAMGFRTSSFLEGPILQSGDILYGLIWDLRTEDSSRVIASIFSTAHHALFRVDITDIISYLSPAPFCGETLHIVVDYCVIKDLLRTVFPCTAPSFSTINTKKRIPVRFDSKGVALFEDIISPSVLFDAKTIWSHNFGYIHGKDEMSELLTTNDSSFRVWIRAIPSMEERLKGKVFMLHWGKFSSERIEDPLYKELRNKCECHVIDGKLVQRSDMTPILDYAKSNVEALPLLTTKEQLQVEARFNGSTKSRPPVLVGARLDIKSIRSKAEQCQILMNDRVAILAKKAERRNVDYGPRPHAVLADQPVKRVVETEMVLPMTKNNPPVIRRNWNFRTSAGSNSRRYVLKNECCEDGNGLTSIECSLDRSRRDICSNSSAGFANSSVSVSDKKGLDLHLSMADFDSPASGSSSSIEIINNPCRRYHVYGSQTQNSKRTDGISENMSISTKTTVDSLLIIKLYERQGDFQGLSRGVAWCPQRGFVDLRCNAIKAEESLEEGAFYSGIVKIDTVFTGDKCGGLYVDKVFKSVVVSRQYQKADKITGKNGLEWLEITFEELLTKCERLNQRNGDEKCLLPVDDYIQNIVMKYDDFLKFQGRRVVVKARISLSPTISNKFLHKTQWECVSIDEVSSLPQVNKVDYELLLKQCKFPHGDFVAIPPEFFKLLVQSELMSNLRDHDWPMFEQLKRVEREIERVDKK